MVVVERQINIRQGLRFHALAGVHQQDRAFARRQRPTDFIGEVDMARCVNQIQNICLTISGGVFQTHRLRLDRNAAFPFNIH